MTPSDEENTLPSEPAPLTEELADLAFDIVEPFDAIGDAVTTIVDNITS